jgi:E3 ubiquitin-protein ligase BAH
MKFGQEFETALAAGEFPQHWQDSAIEYKHLKKCINKIRRELKSIGLDAETLAHLSESLQPADSQRHGSVHSEKGYYSASLPALDSVPEEFTPQLHVLVDSNTGRPLDATLAPDTKEALQKLARHEMMTAGRREHLGRPVRQPQASRNSSVVSVATDSEDNEVRDTRWVQVPLASAQHFFNILEPKLQELEALRVAETEKLENDILDLGDAVEDVVEPVREGFEAKRDVSYRDLYFWREMFRLYMERPIFYSETEARRGALTFSEAKSRLQDYDTQLQETGLLAKMKSPAAQKAAKQFLDLNVDILKIMHFQEMNARAMTKILKKFDKRTHLEGQDFISNLRKQYPALMPSKNSKSQAAGGFANSIARDLHAEIATKVLAIVPQLDDWNCPVCYSMAWRPVNLGCCRSVYCITCIIKLQDEGCKRCPTCNRETVLQADGRNIDFEAMDFLEKYFPMEVKKRQKENEKQALVRTYGPDFVKPACALM